MHTSNSIRSLTGLTLTFCAILHASHSHAQRRGMNPENAPDARMELVVDDTSLATGSVEKIIRDAGGTIESRRTSYDPSQKMRSIVTGLVGSNVIDSVIIKLRNVGTVRTESFDLKPSNSTVRVQVSLGNQPDTTQYAPRYSPTVFAGVTGGFMKLNLSNDNSRTLNGPGIIMSTRGQWAQFSVTLLKDTTKKSPDGTNDSKEEASSSGSSTFLIGHNFYSKFFAGGNYSYMNPHAGITYGYSHLMGRSLFTIGGSIGLEFIRTRFFVWNVSAKILGLYSGRDGGTAALYTTDLVIPF